MADGENQESLLAREAEKSEVQWEKGMAEWELLQEAILGEELRWSVWMWRKILLHDVQCNFLLITKSLLNM